MQTQLSQRPWLSTRASDHVRAPSPVIFPGRGLKLKLGLLAWPSVSGSCSAAGLEPVAAPETCCSTAYQFRAHEQVRSSPLPLPTLSMTCTAVTALLKPAFTEAQAMIETRASPLQAEQAEVHRQVQHWWVLLCRTARQLGLCTAAPWHCGGTCQEALPCCRHMLRPCQSNIETSSCALQALRPHSNLINASRQLAHDASLSTCTCTCAQCKLLATSMVSSPGSILVVDRLGIDAPRAQLKVGVTTEVG